jgi:hypothetical protein
MNAGAQKYFKVLDATSMSWSGGLPQNGSGTTYTIKAVLLTTQKVTFSDIWIGKEYGTPETISFSYSDGRTLTKGDTILIKYTVHQYPPQSPLAQMPKPAYKSPPIPIQGEALLGFTVGKATRYRSVAKFKVLPPANYP